MFICFIVGITGITSSFYNFYDELSIRESHDDYALQQSTRIAYILEAGLFFILPNTYPSRFNLGKKRYCIIQYCLRFLCYFIIVYSF